MNARAEQGSSLAAAYDAVGHDLVAGSPTCPGCQRPAVRVGTDVQAIAAVAEAVEQHGRRYLDRLFTEQELADAQAGETGWSEAGAASLAARYAAKEAVIKVLRPVQSGVDWKLLEIVREPGGWSSICLHGSAQQRAREAGLTAWAVSFAHDEGVAVATVLARHGCGENDPSTRV